MVNAFYSDGLICALIEFAEMTMNYHGRQALRRPGNFQWRSVWYKYTGLHPPASHHKPPTSGYLYPGKSV